MKKTGFIVLSTAVLVLGLGLNGCFFTNKKDAGGLGAETKGGVQKSDAMASYEQACGLYKQGRFDEAIKELEAFVAVFPVSSLCRGAYYYLGVSYQQKGDTKRAEESYNLLIKKYPNTKWAEWAEINKKKIDTVPASAPVAAPAPVPAPAGVPADSSGKPAPETKVVSKPALGVEIKPLEREPLKSGFRGRVFEEKINWKFSVAEDINGAEITFTAENKEAVTVVSKDNGWYDVSLLPGRYTVTAKHTDYEPYVSGRPWIVKEDIIKTNNIMLRPKITPVKMNLGVKPVTSGEPDAAPEAKPEEKKDK